MPERGERRGVHRERRAGGRLRRRRQTVRSTARRASTTSCRVAITALTPEDSDTYSYGVVFQPRWAPGLAITVDYFDIKIKDTISTFGANNTWTACYGQNDAAACSRIERNPGTGQLWVGIGQC